MFDIGWSEMAIIMLLALIIIGPKDLPRVARTIGQWVRKGRMLAREFQTSLEDMAKEAELDDVKKEIEKVGRTDLKKSVENAIDPKGELTKAFDTSSPKTGEAEKASTETATPAKALNGSADAKVGDQAAVKSPAAASPAEGGAATSATESEPAASAKPPAAKKPAAKKPASSKKAAAKAKPETAKKPATPRKRSTKPKTSTASGTGDASPADKGGSGAPMAAKTS